MKVNWGLRILLVEGLRYTKQQTLDKFRFSSFSPRPEVPRKLGIDPKVTSPGAKFEFSLESSEHSSSVSQLVTALQIAGGFIENALNLANKIVVKVCFNSHCSAFGNLEDKKKNLEGKTALMTLSIQPSDDILMPVDYGSDKNQVYDATEVIVHEILHGMGIASFVCSDIAGRVEYIGPIYHSENKKDFKSIYFAKGIFDKYLHSKGESMNDIIHSMSKNVSYRQADA
ncbi:hypothetical protein DSO57_1015771 [Entomophthora muscae]|uniref:Uncharacterized protein n=1 Tax=Entomophthora muscae TaxID=34485 RepID=A0ACC2SI37_9FUNG|nr:hypothetical protein DSO57_1015771 [Entomophthora muscae]